MNFNFQADFFDLVAKDLIDAKKWYYEQSPHTDLEERFSQQVQNTLKNVIKNPFIYHQRYLKIQVAYTKVFPFGIYFYTDEEIEKIIIVAVLHNKMDVNVVLNQRL